MPQYSYTAKNFQGEQETGTSEAQNREELARALRQRGLFLVNVEEKSIAPKKIFKIAKLKFLLQLGGVSLTDKLFFTRNLEVMLRTGIPMARAFELLAKQTQSKRFSEALLTIIERITKGDGLSNALSSFPKIFPVLYRETLKVGEETGKLDESLKVLTLQMEREHSLTAKLKTAMVYPVMVLVLTFGIGIFMFVFAVPKIKQAFTELNVQLPLTTRIILAFADFLSQKWPLAILLGCVLLFLLGLVATVKNLKKTRSWLVLKTPLLSPISRKINSALMLRTVSSLLKAGVPIIKALDVASGSLNNFYFQKSLKEAAKSVEKGRKLAESLSPYSKIYSPMIIQMIEVGEETGETSEILNKLAEFYEEEVSSATEKLSSLIEPLLIIFIGGIVGFFAVSMMQPMFSIMGGIK